MLRQVSRTRVVRAAVHQRSFSVPPKAPNAPKTAPPTTAAKPPSNSKPVPPSPPKSTPASAAADSNTGSSLPKLLLLGLLSTPAATAVYVKQNPEWNPTALKDDSRWIKFRELVLGKEANTPAAVKRSPEDFSAAISKGEKEVKKEAEKAKKKVEKVEKKIEKKVEKKEEEKEDKKEKKEKK
ncbi:hypothetical protein PHMEG_00011083, partial [Phytophthora megakarya]